MPDDVLFSTQPVAGKKVGCPLLVVGLPRSGSSFLSEVVSQIEDWYVFDDLYVHRKAMQIGTKGSLKETEIDKLLFFLGWQIRARLRSGKYAIPNVEESEIEEMNSALKSCILERHGNWAELQEEWMTRLAMRSGCSNWGYKMPQAFRYLDELFDHYPDMKVIFLMRTPQDVLASYKHMRSDSSDGDRAQYHPIAHAIYWRQAGKAYLDSRQKYKDRVTLVRFEDLVANPSLTAKTIAGFLDAKQPTVVKTPPRPNTSFKSSELRKGLNGLELFFLDKIAGKMRDGLGFEPAKQKISVLDFVDLLKTSAIFTIFRSKKLANTARQKFSQNS